MTTDESKRYVASLSPHPLEAMYDRITRKHEQGRALRLSPEEVDWFVVSGAYAALLQAVARERFNIAAARIEARGGDLSFLSSGVPADVEPATTKVVDQERAPEPASERHVFTPKTLAERWGVSAASVYSLMKSGKLPHFKLGGQLYRIPLAAVLAHEKTRS